MTATAPLDDAAPWRRFDREALAADVTAELIEPRPLSDDEAEILELHRQWLVSNRIGDNDWCREHFAPDAVLCNTNGSLYRGVEHWCALWDEYRTRIAGPSDDVDKTPPLFVSWDVVVRVIGDVGWVSYRSSFNGRWRSDERNPFSDTDAIPPMGRGTLIFERHDGVWQLAHGHFSKGKPGQHANGL